MWGGGGGGPPAGARHYHLLPMQQTKHRRAGVHTVNHGNKHALRGKPCARARQRARLPAAGRQLAGQANLNSMAPGLESRAPPMKNSSLRRAKGAEYMSVAGRRQLEGSSCPCRAAAFNPAGQESSDRPAPGSTLPRGALLLPGLGPPCSAHALPRAARPARRGEASAALAATNGRAPSARHPAHPATLPRHPAPPSSALPCHPAPLPCPAPPTWSSASGCLPL